MLRIVIIIVLAILLSDETKRNKKLQERIKQLENQQNKNDINEKTQNNIESKTNIIPSKSTEEIKTSVNKHNRENIKNNAILITGSIFIVLAAIVFLTSTWSIIPSIIKTTILVALVAVFLGASSIAENVFKLKDTSKAFYYIAMAYIPICLVSISVFGLFGNFLSIMGEGKFIYLTIVSIILSLIYYTGYYKHRYKSMYISNLIAQVFSVIFSMLIFKASAINTFIAILIYNVVLLFIAKDKATNIFCKILVISAGLLSVIIDLKNNITWAMPVALFTIAITLMLFSIREKNNKKVYLTIITILFTLIGYSIIINLELSYNAYVIYALLIYVLAFINIIKEKNVCLILKYMSYILIPLTYTILIAINFSNFINDTIYFILLLAMWIFSTSIEKNMDLKVVFKVLTIISMYLLLFSISYLLKLENIRIYIPTIATVALLFIEVVDEKLRDLTSLIILSISETIAFITLYYANNSIAIPTMILFAFCIVIINNVFIKKNEVFDIVPLLGIWIKFVSMEVNFIPNEVLLGIISIITLGVSVYKKRLSVYTGVSGLFLLSAFDFINNAYINSILFILWNTMNWLTMKKEKSKDLFKFLTCTGITYLLCIATKDVFIDLNSINIIIILIYVIFVIKTIIKKYNKDILPIEACALSLVYLYEINNYKSEIDGMIFVLCIIANIIYSYNIKDSAIFITSLIAIIINIFVLTRDFWLSIPWWIYMLTVGIVLISFAVYNETNTEKNKDIIENIKKKLTFKS